MSQKDGSVYKIEQLTDEQKAIMSVCRDRWIAIGLATERRGFDRAPKEKAILNAYKCAGLKEPETFIWTESPLHTGVCYALLKSNERASVRGSVGASVRGSVWDSVGASVWDRVRGSVRGSVWDRVRGSVWDRVGASVWDSVRGSVGDSVGASVRDSVWGSVWGSVRDSVRGSVGASVGASVWDSVRDSCYGSHDANWLAFYRYFHDLGIDCSKLSGLWECAETCGWFMPFANAVIVSPRPYQIRTRINTRGNHELHADGEPAVYYCDDFQIYANGGVRLPPKYGAVKTALWDSRWLLTEENAELRMCIIKVIGYDKLCQELEAKKIDSWREYELIRIENADVEPMVLLKMVCPSTGKIHAARMPPTITKAREAAMALNCGIDPETFILEH